MRSASLRSRIGAAGCIALPVSLFTGLMIATAGIALYPPVAFIATPLICSGEVEIVSRGQSYRPGEYIVTRNIYCVSAAAEGKSAREDITLKAAGAAFLIYSAIAFVLLRFIAAPWLRRRFANVLGSARVPGPASPASPAAPSNVQTIFERFKEAVERRGGSVVGRDRPGDDDDLAGRLAQLGRLRDDGLITAQDYEAKKAEILSRL